MQLKPGVLLAGTALAVLAFGLVAPAAAAESRPTLSMPAVRLYAGETEDSDDVLLQQRGVELEALAFGAVRLGMLAEHSRLSEPTAAGTADAFALRARWQPDPALHVDGLAGVVRLSPGSAGEPTVDRPQAGLRLRWRPVTAGPSAEMRLARRPLLASPALLTQPVDLTELRAVFTAPLAGPFLGRARVQQGVLDETRQTNRRSGYELAGLFELAPSAEVGLAYSDLGYRRKAQAAYSAPRRVHGVELAAFGEWDEAWGPLSMTLDAGIGRQQVSRHDEAPRDWTKVLRLLVSLSCRVAPGADLGLSLEHNESPLGGNGTVSSSMWRSTSVTLSLRVAMR